MVNSEAVKQKTIVKQDFKERTFGKINQILLEQQQSWPAELPCSNPFIMKGLKAREMI